MGDSRCSVICSYGSSESDVKFGGGGNASSCGRDHQGHRFQWVLERELQFLLSILLRTASHAEHVLHNAESRT